MPSNSNTSSVDAQNGSSYSRCNADFTSQESHPGTTYATDYTTQARLPVGVPYPRDATTTTQDTRTITNDQPYQNGYAVDYSDENSYTNGDYSQSASSYDTVSPSNQPQVAHWDGQGYQHYRQYYLPPTSYPQETPKYDPEIVIDSIEDEPVSSQYSNLPEHGSARARSQQHAAASTHQNPHQTNVARTPTARRWSREYSPEERMRVGLSRWETEQDRMDYYERQQRQGRRRS